MRVFFVIGVYWLLLLGSVAVADVGQRPDDQADAKTHFQLGSLRFNAGDWAGAITEYEVAYRVFPMPEFLFNIARAYESADKLDEAKRYFLDYLQREPDGRGSADARSRLAGVLARIHGVKRVLLPRAKMAAVAARVKIEAELRFRLGTEALDRKSYQEALADYEKAFALVPLSDFLFNLAKVYDESGNLPNANERYLEYLAHEPNGPGNEMARARVVDILLQQLAAAAPPKPVPTWVDRPRVVVAVVPEKHRRLWILAPVLAAVAIGVGVGVGVGVTQAQVDPLHGTNVNFTVKFGM